MSCCGGGGKVLSEIISFVGFTRGPLILNWPWRTRSRTRQNAYPSLWFVWLDRVVGNALWLCYRTDDSGGWPSHFG
jgi:hypothetical protein